ncbi:MAG: NAD(P)-binding protein [Myxococcales bacterium]|nr:NAD(P)-binding protein [Myxococcales bacterium]
MAYDPTQKKEKIAILGGGISSMVTAFELTSEPNWQDRYDITVYQTGWRLGGKGASSRNPEHANRIEEHGLHVFYGFYENAFEIVRRCYQELGRSPEQPLATWEKAFTPHNFITLQEKVGERWDPWFLPFPPAKGTPGDGQPLPDLWASVSHLVEYAASVFDYWHFGTLPDKPDSFSEALRKHGGQLIGQMLQILREDDATLGDRLFGALQCWMLRALQLGLQGLNRPKGLPRPLGSGMLWLASLLMKRMSQSPEGQAPAELKLLAWFLRQQREWVHRLDRNPREGNQYTRRMMICEDLFLSTIIGLIEEGTFGKEVDWRRFDHIDVKDWLEQHGAHPTTIHSTLIHALYDAAFSQEYGVAAGTLIHCMIRMFGTYKGAFMWKMNAGMGETIFSPLYLVLRQRGVQFKFFHRVDRLEVAQHHKEQHIQRIHIGQQATLKGDTYEPLVDVDGLPCWPHTPLFEQLVEGDALRESGCSLEDWWTTWQDPAAPVILEAGKDFDRVVLGISIGALPYLCQEMIEHSPRFAAMIEGVKTTQTQAVQIWMTPTLEETGWKEHPTIAIQFAAPFDTWADMTHLLPIEGSPEGHPVGSIAYLCSGMPDDEPLPPRGPNDYAKRQNERVRQHALRWLKDHGHHLWPNLRGERLWEAMIDPQHRHDEARFDAQYWHAPPNPSDRYVVAPAGSTQYRLRTDESGFSNVYLTGDWILTALNIGCVEAATLAGRQTAQAILGQYKPLPGDWLGHLFAQRSKEEIR